jgi:MOSC domain-containing protein YiiM
VTQLAGGEEVVRVVSVNVGLPRTVRWKGRDVTTGIFKEPVEDRVSLRRLNLDGDRQADLAVHGGAAKAVYAYPLEHYAFWRQELGEELRFGAFGENLTVEGLPLEEEIAVGDRFRVGTAELVVTQPRLPCYKLGLRFGREDMVKRFLASRRTGYYLAVEVEGNVGAGDHVELIARDPARIPVAEITRVYASDQNDHATIERLVALDALPDDWRSYFEKQLAKCRPRRRASSSLDETRDALAAELAGALAARLRAKSSAAMTRTTTRRASSTGGTSSSCERATAGGP